MCCTYVLPDVLVKSCKGKCPSIVAGEYLKRVVAAAETEDSRVVLL